MRRQPTGNAAYCNSAILVGGALGWIVWVALGFEFDVRIGT